MESNKSIKSNGKGKKCQTTVGPDIGKVYKHSIQNIHWVGQD